MKVSNIMTRSVVTVKQDASLKEAAGILAKLRIHGMPVVDADNKVVGIITESDFFAKDASNIYLPTFLDFVSKDKEDSLGFGHRELSEKTNVADIMTKKCLTINQDAAVQDLIYKFKDSTFNSIPVVDGAGRLVGIVTTIDVINLL